MLAKCANPACNALFLYLRDGKLYQMEVAEQQGRPEQENLEEARKPLRRVEFFWLCSGCAQQMTLAYDRQRGLIVLPVRIQQAAAS